MTGYRETLNAWAVSQLQTRSHHEGPFHILKVDIEYNEACRYSEDTVSDAELFVRIRFRDREGNEATWVMTDTRTSVDLLNELLAIEEQTSWSQMVNAHGPLTELPVPGRLSGGPQNEVTPRDGR